MAVTKLSTQTAIQNIDAFKNIFMLVQFLKINYFLLLYFKEELKAAQKHEPVFFIILHFCKNLDHIQLVFFQSILYA